MATDTIIAERPIPPKGRLSFPMLILRMIVNPVASWGEDFYEEPAVLYRWLGLQTLYVMDPVLIQRILLEDAESYSKQPLNDDVFGEAIGGGLLNAEGDKSSGSAVSQRPCSGPRGCWLMCRPSPQSARPY